MVRIVIYKRFLFAPAAALALFAFAIPASAQSNPADEFRQLRLDSHRNHLAVGRIERVVNRCEAASEDEVQQVAEATHEIINRAAGLAPQLGGREHVSALTMKQIAELDFWYLVTFQAPEVCYQPPAQ